jgi:hypothetical protein
MRELGLTYTARERETLGLAPRRPHPLDTEISRASRSVDPRTELATATPANGGRPTPTTPLPIIVKGTQIIGDGLRIDVKTPAGEFSIVITAAADITQSGAEEGLGNHA